MAENQDFTLYGRDEFGVLKSVRYYWQHDKWVVWFPTTCHSEIGSKNELMRPHHRCPEWI